MTEQQFQKDKENLLACFQGYSEIERGMYYSYLFNEPSSTLRSEITTEASKETMDKVMAILNFSSEYIPETKNWKIEDYKPEKIKENYINEYLFSNKEAKELVLIMLQPNRLVFELLYSSKNEQSEKWALEKTLLLQKEFRNENKATFEILSKNDNGFYTEEIDIKPMDLNIQDSFNADFEEIDDIINTSIKEERAGLILLHGLPGTGKTSYIKSLINKFGEKNFIFVQNEFVRDLLNPGFVNFLISKKESILVIEDAEKVIMSREDDPNNSVVSTILQLTDGLFSDYLSLKIICTFNTDIEKIDKALLRKGRMIAYYDFQKLSKDKSDALLEKLGSPKQNKELTLAEIYNTQNKDFNKKSKNLMGFR
jgi:hypothetical protein